MKSLRLGKNCKGRTISTKLHINLQQGVLEVEGEEEFVREVYEEFKANLKGQLGKQTLYPKKEVPKSQKTSSSKSSYKKPTSKKAPNSKIDAQKLDKDLDLSGGGKQPSLKEYCEIYEPKTNLERNVVFISYLEEVVNLEKVTVNHVWTCYNSHDLGLKLPVNMKQSLYDTSAKGWINTPSLADISLSVLGKNWLIGKKNKSERKS